MDERVALALIGEYIDQAVDDRTVVARRVDVLADQRQRRPFVHTGPSPAGTK